MPGSKERDQTFFLSHEFFYNSVVLHIILFLDFEIHHIHFNVFFFFKNCTLYKYFTSKSVNQFIFLKYRVSYET